MLNRVQRFERSEQHAIPMKLLARQDPVLDQILYYDDVSLFEDELHDNGESILNVRIVRLRVGLRHCQGHIVCVRYADDAAGHAALVLHPLETVPPGRQRVVPDTRREDIPRVWERGDCA